MSPGTSIDRARGMARRRIVDLIIGAAVALALIGLAPGHAPALTVFAHAHHLDFKIGGRAKH